MNDKETNKFVPYENFASCDIRMGTITKAEAIPKAKKLLKLEVSFGSEVGVRTIVAGIAEDFSPEVLPGRQVMAVLNLEPRTMMGIESRGMILATKDSEGKLVLPGCPGVIDGAKIG